MWTLTYKVAREKRATVAGDLRQFYIRLQSLYGRMPLLAVIERGKRGTRRLHVHLAVDRWLHIDVLRDCWRLGHVWVGDGTKCPGNPGVKRLARYLAKYIAKEVQLEQDGEAIREPGAHRYLTTQGWAVPAIRARFPSSSRALSALTRVYSPPELVIAFGDPGVDPVWGYWLAFPDHALIDAPAPYR
jgi:hypothetical protein